jgi:hypothetical protein
MCRRVFCRRVFAVIISLSAAAVLGAVCKRGGCGKAAKCIKGQCECTWAMCMLDPAERTQHIHDAAFTRLGLPAIPLCHCPSSAPSKTPTVDPTPDPTESPTLSPTAPPPTLSPTAPTYFPSYFPTAAPFTADPTYFPTMGPLRLGLERFALRVEKRRIPTASPTETYFPTMEPTLAPSLWPTWPTTAPSPAPTGPTSRPTSPSLVPTAAPTNAPSETWDIDISSTLESIAFKPTVSPTATPSRLPTSVWSLPGYSALTKHSLPLPPVLHTAQVYPGIATAPAPGNGVATGRATAALEEKLMQMQERIEQMEDERAKTTSVPTSSPTAAATDNSKALLTQRLMQMQEQIEQMESTMKLGQQKLQITAYPSALPHITSHPTVVLWRPALKVHSPVRRHSPYVTSYPTLPRQHTISHDKKSAPNSARQTIRANQNQSSTRESVAGPHHIDTSTSKADCAAGRYPSEFGVSLICLPCSHGQYQKVPNSCSACPQGYFSGLAQTKCDSPTPAPTPPLAPTPSPWAPGSAYGEMLLLKELATDAPSNAPSRGPTHFQCPSGKWAPSVTDCGLVKNDVEASVCRRTVATHGCVMCTSGRFKALAGHTTCAFCEVGRFQDRLGQFECLACPAGKFQPTPGRTVCRVMEPGTVMSHDGRVVCSRGRFSTMMLGGAQLGVPDCVSCKAGRFQPQPGQSSCLLCKAGDVASQLFCSGEHLSKPVAVAARASPQQAEGFHPSATRGTITANIKVNNAPKRTGSSKTVAKATLGSVHPCLAGLYQVLYGDRQYCLSCPRGKFSARGGKLCTPCPVDQYQPLSKQRSCLMCKVGTHQSEQGSTSCTASCNTARSGPWSVCTSFCGIGTKYRYHQKFTCRGGQVMYGIKTKQRHICTGTQCPNKRERDSVDVPPL